MLITIILLQMSFLLASNPDTTSVVLAEKQSVTINTNNRDRIFVEDGSIVKLMQFAAGYKVVTKKVGTTKIYTSKKTWVIHSITLSDYNYYQKLLDAVKDMRGITVDWVNGCTQLNGKLLRLDDLDKIKTSISEYKNKSCDNTFKNKLIIDTTSSEELHKYLSDVYQNQNLLLPIYKKSPHLQFYINDTESKAYNSRLNNYGFIFIADKDSISTTPNIETEIIVTEVRKKELTQFGVSWPSSVEVQVSQKNIETLPFSWSLQAIEENGFGKILASPKIVSVGGKEAEFLAGGEIPLRAMGHKRNEIIWKSYGILLKVLPTIDAQKRLRLKLNIEVSILDASQKVDGLPGFLTNRISSEFLIKDNEALIISGLLKEHNSQSTQGLPGLNQIPILGKLFGSEDYQNNKTELVILVRPRIQP